MSSSDTIPVYAVALSEATDQTNSIGDAKDKAEAARLIRKYLREHGGDPDPDVPASAVVYSRGGYWIND